MQKEHDIEHTLTDLILARTGAATVLSALLWTPLERSAIEAAAERNLAFLGEFLGVLGRDVQPSVRIMQEWLAARSSEESERILNVEATRLFSIGHEDLPAPPYGSVWLEPEGLMMGQTTAGVMLAYKLSGFDVSDQTSNTVPDHIARELEFVAHLGRRALEVSVPGDIEQARIANEETRQFVERYCMPWWSDFADAVIANAETAFFTGVAELLKEFTLHLGEQ